MSAAAFIRDPNNRLDIVAGLVDGILNALTLAAGRLAHAGGEGATFSLAFRVSVAAGATTIFVFFIAHYAQLRLDLIRHERELNFTEHGRLAATRLGRRVFFESLLRAMLAAGFSLVGALFPLLLCAIVPSPRWLGLAITIIVLSGLGALLARTIYGSPVVWGVGHFIVGIALALVGMQLDLVG
jgi:VIT1/CCC1 family predicted Fe2+/Mn2+ transporter